MKYQKVLINSVICSYAEHRRGFLLLSNNLGRLAEGISQQWGRASWVFLEKRAMREERFTEGIIIKQKENETLRLKVPPGTSGLSLHVQRA